MRSIPLVLLLAALTTPGALSQTFTTDDPVIRAMWQVGIEESQTEELAHVLMDRIGPRLAGSTNLDQAQDWLIETYGSWGIPARREQVGEWTAWEAGILHVDMIAPRVATLEAELLAWSPGTDGPVEAEVVLPPAGLARPQGAEWLASVAGKFVLMSPPEPMCRAQQELEKFGQPGAVEAVEARRVELRRDFASRYAPVASGRGMQSAVDSAGAAGILTSRWSGGWGVNKVFSTQSENAVAIDLSCEDYGLLYRLVAGGETPVLRVEADARILGKVPQYNVIAEMRGTEKPDEYVLLGAHLDSWHAATGATDNGTGTITMLEAARILRETYPDPKRTILVGHWANEEMGLIGSGAFREDHPEVMAGLQVAFNQDNGTWAFEKIEGQGFLSSAEFLPRWMAPVPTEIASRIELELPGPQDNRGSDHTSFVCAGLPSFRLQSPYDEYRQYTWHTNRDTYDKIVFEDLSQNATVAAMLAYMASEDPEMTGREKALLPIDPGTGQPREWGSCRPPRRTDNR